MKTARLSLLLLGVVLAGGCAFGTRTAELTYPPAREGGGLIATAGAAEAVPATRAPIAVTVVDARAERERIGNVRNGFGMDTANVVTDSDVRAWVEDALVAELANAGYDVVETDPTGTSADGIAMRAEILTVYCDVYLTYDGDVSLMLNLENRNRDAVRTQLAGEGSVGLNFAATAASYAESLALALEDVIGKVLVELESYR